MSDDTPEPPSSGGKGVVTIKVMPRPDYRRRLVVALQYGLIVFGFLALIHNNIVEIYFAKDYKVYLPANADGTLKPKIQRGYDRLVDYGQRMGLGSVWKMYSPPWPIIREVEWLAESPEGEWVSVTSVPNLSKEYREKRSFTAALFWDFKVARIHDNYMLYDETFYGETNLLKHFVDFQQQRMAEELGWEPVAVRVIARDTHIPPPAEKGSWTTYGAPPDVIAYDKTFRYKP